MQKIILNCSIYLFLFLAGAAVDHFYFAKPDLVTNTEVTKASEATTVDKSKETISRDITIKPDGTQIIHEDVVKDFFIERMEKENILLKQTIAENKKPEYLITLFPAYNFNTERIVYGIAIEKRVFSGCYLGLSLDQERIGVPFTCSF